LNHRVKNTLATVQSIVRQTLRNGEASIGARDALTSRIVALSKAHDVLTDEQWSGADLGQIVGQAAHPFRLGLGAERIQLKGPQVRVPPKTAIAMALAIHELATNAAKYGALSGPKGHATFSWRLKAGHGPRELFAVWQEFDGPPVAPPTRSGFGTRLIERGLASDLNGEVTITYPPAGVVCTIHARLDPANDETAPFGPADADWGRLGDTDLDASNTRAAS
ncbi:MAG: sensor histidine kinase, partial [Phenylobacterium sp.]|nr:sensor histidine kinase [Phenylobacterium sp.]